MKRFEELKNHVGQNLEERRAKLKELYESDDRLYKQKLDALKETPLQRVEQMRKRVEELRNAREKERQQIVEEKLLQRFRNGCDELRERESQVLDRELTSAREAQLAEHAERLRIDAENERQFAEAWEKDRQQKVRREEVDAAAAQARTRDQMTQLEAQMQEFRDRIEHEKQLRKAAGELLLQQIEQQKLDAMRDKLRKEQEQFAVRAELDKFNTARIAQKRKAAAESLALDLKIIGDFLAAEQKEREKKDRKRVELRQEMAAYRIHLLEQQQQAIELEQQLQGMYKAEADKAQEIANAKLAREQAARDRLMEEVMKARAQQLHEAATRNAELLQQLQLERTQLQEKIVEIQKQDALNKAQDGVKRQQYKTNLETQISERAAQRAEQIRLQKVEEEAEKQARAELERMIQYELDHVTDLPRVKAFRQDNLVKK